MKSPNKTIIKYREDEEEDEGEIVSSSVDSSPAKLAGSENDEFAKVKMWKCPKCNFHNDLNLAICSNDQFGGCDFNMEKEAD